MKNLDEISKTSTKNGTSEVENRYTANIKMTNLNLAEETGDEIMSKKSKMEMQLQEISRNLKVIIDHIDSERQEEELKEQWEFLVSVLDRFLFVISLIFLIIITISTLLVNKNFWRN